MLENVGRKVTLIIVMLAVSLALLLIPEKPFNLGLDLRGGTRLTYSFDFESAVRDGTISRAEADDPGQLIGETISIIRNRVDPTGTREASIRQEGANRVVIELPGTLGLSGTSATAPLAAPMTEALAPIRIDAAQAEAFPVTGGRISIGEELLRYTTRDGDTLVLADRGLDGSRTTGHDAGEVVTLVSDDVIRQAIENLGDLSFQIVAKTADFERFGTDETTERGKMRRWLAANQGAPLWAYNRLTPEEGGPAGRIRWYRERAPEATGEAADLALPILEPESEDERFRGSDLARVFPSQDETGYPAVGFEMQGPRQGDFGRFTKKNVDRSMVIILNSEVVSVATIQQRISKSGIIRGTFSADEVKNLVTVLRSGSLKIRPTLEHEEVVGPTLGADYVVRGFYSGLVAMIVVLAFMIFYYRRLGLYSAAALILAFVMLMGGLAFLNATLTLPGIAGIILTVGMAVDANILIFDRIREEMDKGRNVKQAAKTGFEMARSAIVDSNVTSFLTALILYKIGTGPIRGFAVTLMIGIVASVFSALVLTRVLVHFGLVRGVKTYKVGQLFVTANYKFLDRAVPAFALSTVLMLASLIGFTLLPANDKLGIDFVGGAEVQLRTAKPESIETLREAIASLPGLIGRTAEVKPVASTAEDGGYTEFRATFKTPEEGTVDPSRFEGDIKTGLRELLLTDGVRVSQTADAEKPGTSDVRVDLLFEEPHAAEDIARALASAPILDLRVESAERNNAYVVTGEASAAVRDDEILTAVKAALQKEPDSAGHAYNVATPIPSTSTVGAQVVGELRDKALIAIAVSLFVIVLYIRVRFAEYSYGYAAVAALFHDVLVTLGVLMLANKLGIVNGEINLPTIAVFLTIIGYSLNDTIVIFDRVRENLPRMKMPLKDVLDLSINQTLSRTVLTSGTTMLAVIILYAFNFGTGNVLETFSFAMIIGIITGTYSTMYIANAVFLWLEERSMRKRRSGDGKSLQAPSRRDKEELAKA